MNSKRNSETILEKKSLKAGLHDENAKRNLGGVRGSNYYKIIL